ncbi:MAG TPA: hypothetical protein VGC80_07505 [Acetobacteraceae bacterium]
MTDPGHPDGRSRRPWLEALPEQAGLEDAVVLACDKLAQAQAALQRAQEGAVSAIADLPQDATAEYVRLQWQASQELIGTLISQAIEQGDAHIRAVEDLFGLA